MHLIQLFLPLYRPNGEPIAREAFVATRDELVARHGGMTAYNRAPAHGLWQEEGNAGGSVHDDLVIYEVMCDNFDARQWTEYRRLLEVRFEQERILARAQQIEVL